MKIRVAAVDLRVLPMRTRIPFRYGIATMVEVPHLFLRATLELDGARASGLAADHLPPKWFTKNPDTTPAEDLAAMLDVIEQAAALAPALPAADSLFDLWRDLYECQRAWAAETAHPPLLWGFGVSLVERAALDAFCRHRRLPLARVLRENALGVRLGEIHPELAGRAPREFLPPGPLRELRVRHTVGLGDPLTDADIAPADRVDDGLPQSLQACVAAYGLTHFKIKIGGRADEDLDRLDRIAEALAGAGTGPVRFTLDGNETYPDLASFRSFWSRVSAEPGLTRFLQGLLFVEQPLPRDRALDGEVARDLSAWDERPPIILDESDAELDSLPRALAAGYAGASHKNCKGVIKGLANACLIEHRRRRDAGRPAILSGEDLSNVGPVALLQDLAVAANLGIAHLERNGHHYFAGLSALPRDLQQALRAAHPDLYRMHERGFPTLDIQKGVIRVGSVIEAPFGVGLRVDAGRFAPLADFDARAWAGPAGPATGGATPPPAR